MVSGPTPSGSPIQPVKAGLPNEVLSPEDVAALHAKNLPKLTAAKYRSPQTALKFYIPREVFEPLVDRKYARVIESHYFPKQLCKPLLSMLGFIGFVPHADSYTTARIQAVRHPLAEAKFYLDFKGPKGNTPEGRIARSETDSFDITRETFERLKEWATAGSMVVDRYEVAGQVSAHRLFEPLTAEVDRIVATGRPLKAVESYFARVDIEPANRGQVAAIRGGKHSFEFLQRCIELTNQDEKIQKALSATRLAQNGIGKEAREVIKRLEKELRRK